MISFQVLESYARGEFRYRFLAGIVIVGFSSLAAFGQEKRRGLAGKNDFEDSPMPPANAGAQAGGSGPAIVPKFELKPRVFKDAMVTPDAKLVEGAPFDTKAYFFMPPEEENAGPLVLDALTDFPELYSMFNPGDAAGLEQRRTNVKTARDWLDANPNPRNWDANSIEQAFGPFRTTFAKLHEAHKKPDCIIPTNISLEVLLPHVQASGMISRLAGPLIYADLARGDKTGAIEKFADALRLGQDLQPRAFVVNLIVVANMHKTMSESALPVLLNAKNLTAADYDKILAALKAYRAGSINLLPELLKSEYLIEVSILEGLNKPGGVDQFVKLTNELKGGAAGANDETMKKLLAKLITPENVSKLKAGLARAAREQQAAIKKIASVDDLKKIGGELDEIAQDAYSDAMAEILTKETIDQFLAVAGSANPAIAEAAKQAAAADPKLVAGLVASQIKLKTFNVKDLVIPLLYFQNDQGVMESLTAIRRWYVTKKSTPKNKSLEDVCKEAGMNGAPLDIFTGKPMRMIWTQSGPAVLTAGHDFKDDDGKTLMPREERSKPGNTGDVVDTLAMGGNPSQASQAGDAAGIESNNVPGIGPAGSQGGQAGAQGGGVRPPGVGSSGGRRGREEGVRPEQP